MSKNFINEFAQKIGDHMPDGLKQTHAEVEKMIKNGVEQAVAKFSFVKQEEFEVQQKILLKTREQVDLLTQKVISLEEKLDALSSKERL